MLAGIGIWKISSVACGFSSIKIDYSDYPKSLISKINEVYVFSIKSRYSDILLEKHKLHFSSLFCCNHTCYCVNVVSVTSASHFITSASHYHPRYQRDPRCYHVHPWSDSTIFAELAEAVPIEAGGHNKVIYHEYHLLQSKVNHWLTCATLLLDYLLHTHLVLQLCSNFLGYGVQLVRIYVSNTNYSCFFLH